jgi:hypothetical protein
MATRKQSLQTEFNGRAWGWGSPLRRRPGLEPRPGPSVFVPAAPALEVLF